MTFFAKPGTSPTGTRDGCTLGRRGIFIGKVEPFRGDWQLTNPQMVLFGDDATTVTTATLSLESIGPSTRSTRSPRASSPGTSRRPSRFALDRRRRRARAAARRRARASTTLLDAAHGARLDPRPRRPGRRSARPSTGSGSRRRWSPSWCWPGARRACARWAPGPHRRRRRAAGGVRRAAAVRAHRAASARSAREIEHDLAQPHPMNRLLQGEVGSGKTLVALRAMLRVVDSGGQAALLAPDRGARPAAPPLDHRAARRPRGRRDARRRRRGAPPSSCSPAR